MEDEGQVNDFLWIKVHQQANRTILLLLAHLIDSILQDLHFQDNTNECTTPALSTQVPHKDKNGAPMIADFNYCINAPGFTTPKM